MKANIKNKLLIAIPTLVIGLLLGWIIFGGDSSSNEDKTEKAAEAETWTCSMHPQIRQSEPGQCPLCGMDLIPVSEDKDRQNFEIKMSPTAMQLANVQTVIVEKQKPIKEVHLNGKVSADETKISSQSSHLPGRIEKLFVSFTGERVRRGQTLAMIYSPELVTAQEELFEAYKIKDKQPGLFKAAREKLKNWKLTEGQIDQIIEDGNVKEQFPILADVGGIVLKKKVNLGDYIIKGQTIYEIADLDKVWVLLDVYESDIPWVKEGDSVEFSVKSYPGQVFKGKISFIDPVISSKTRVAQARIEMNNPGMRQKPEMLVEAVIESPMEDTKEEIIVPKTAVMWTGERSLVYIKHERQNEVSFSMREVTLGPALGDRYIIKEGIEVGEEIAVHGTFSIDAAAQLAGKPSMMNKDAGMKSENDTDAKTSSYGISQKAQEALIPVIDDYLAMKSALANDNFKEALKGAKSLDKALNEVDMKLFKGDAHMFWMDRSKEINESLSKAIKSENIEELRKWFKPLSEEVVILFKSFGSPKEKLYVEYCPMADSDKGANWLSAEQEIRNPYFGASMLKCGEVEEEINLIK
tara:strand:- start:6206 stop:7945 length:1740 start_codon:yes stop_codon:yes gene_type:complete